MTEYYVSVNGLDSNNGLSPETPWRYIQTGVNHAHAGDTVHIMAGLYQEKIHGVYSGTAGNYITVTNHNNETPIIDGAWMTEPSGGLVSFTTGQNYIRLSNLTVRNSSGYGLFFPQPIDHMWIDNCDIFGHSLSGIYFYPSYGQYQNPTLTTNVMIENNIIHDCQNWWYWSQIYPGVTGLNEGVSIANVDGFIFRHNYMYFNHKDPFDCKDYSRNGQIYGNINDTYVTPDFGGGGFYFDAYDKVGGLKNIDVFNNIVYGPNTGFTIGTEVGGTCENIHLFNNIYYGTGPAFQIDNMWHTKSSNCETAMCSGEISSTCCEIPGTIPGVSPHLKTGCYIINNTVYNASHGFRMNDRSESYLNQDFIVRNNIFYTTNGITKGTGNIDFSRIVIDHNLFKPGAYSATKGTDYIMDDPLFISPDTREFRLQAASPCINTGSKPKAPLTDFDGFLRGELVDMGAFEYGATLSVDDYKTFIINVQ